MTVIRQYRVQDRQQLLALARENYRCMYPHQSGSGQQQASMDSYCRHLLGIHDSGAGYLFVAEIGDELIGYVCLQGPVAASEGGDSEAYAFLSDLFVVAAQRRRGAGRQLVTQAEAHAHETGMGKIALRVLADNRTARHFYASLRYHEDFVVLSKDLD